MTTPGPTPLRDLIAGLAERADTLASPRAPLHPDRIGVTRHRLPVVIRRSVLYRDAFTCTWCGANARRHDLLQVDHVRPWSAGGADHPVNLRTLCKPCNGDRSNRTSALDFRRLPIVLRCRRCETGDVGEARYVNAYCLACQLTGAAPYMADLLIGGPVPGDEQLPPRRDADDDFTGIPLGQRADVALTLALLVERVSAMTVPCPWCLAEVGEPCGAAGYPLTRTTAHPSRVALAEDPRR